MWRGFWYAKGAVGKWNRADQVLTGMKWSYYTGRQLQISHISLLETHLAAISPGLKEAAGEKDGDVSSSRMSRHAQSIARTNPDCQMHDAAGHAHMTRVESAHPDSHSHAPQARRIETQNDTDFGASGEGNSKSHAGHPSRTAPEITATAAALSPDSSAGAPAIPIPFPASNPVSLNMEAAPISDDAPIMQMCFDAASAPKATRAGGTGIPPAANNIPAIPAFSDAVSLAIGMICRIAKHPVFGAKLPGGSAADGMRDENGNTPDSARASANAHFISSPLLRPQGINENGTGVNGQARQRVPHDSIPKRKGAQLKVARADALPPQ
jgi:hypothetical protein